MREFRIDARDARRLAVKPSLDYIYALIFDAATKHELSLDIPLGAESKVYQLVGGYSTLALKPSPFVEADTLPVPLKAIVGDLEYNGYETSIVKKVALDAFGEAVHGDEIVSMTITWS